MVRQCAANGCKETDASMISHRFPKDKAMATKWKEALNLQQSTEELHSKVVVCTKHFSASSYRNECNNCLNTTAVPNLEQNPENERQYIKDRSKKPAVPARCFKLPPDTEQVVYRFVKRKNSLESQSPAKRPTMEFEIFTVAENEEVQPDADLSEPELQYETSDEGLDESVEESSQELEIPMPNRIPEAPVPQPHPALKVDCCVQTEALPVVPPPKPIESKDDKIVALLYPEFSDISKVKLIEQVKEKDQRILVLEEKVKKLEEAMRNLL